MIAPGRSRPRATIVAGLAPVIALLGCGSSEPPPPAYAGPTYELGGSATGSPTSSGTPLERYFPLVNGYIYSYATMTETGEQGVLMLTALRSSPMFGEIRGASRLRRFAYTPEGVVNADIGAFLLKTPLAPENSWRGEHGGLTRVEAADLTIAVPAGTFAGCVRTVEERRGDVPIRYTTVFCPDIGVVALEVVSGMSLERAELKSYAPPVQIGPDGVVTTQRPSQQ